MLGLLNRGCTYIWTSIIPSKSTHWSIAFWRLLVSRTSNDPIPKILLPLRAVAIAVATLIVFLDVTANDTCVRTKVNQSSNLRRADAAVPTGAKHGFAGKHAILPDIREVLASLRKHHCADVDLNNDEKGKVMTTTETKDILTRVWVCYKGGSRASRLYICPDYKRTLPSHVHRWLGRFCRDRSGVPEGVS